VCDTGRRVAETRARVARSIRLADMKKLGMWWLMGACIASVACGDDDGSAHSLEGDAAHGHDPGEECLPDTPMFTYGKEGGLSVQDATKTFSVRVNDAEYAPPAKDFNDWTIQVLDGAGSPLTQAKLAWACAWMPAHGHGSNPMKVAKLDDAQYEMLGQNMGMFGGWLVQLWIDPDGDLQDEYLPGANSGAVGGNACSPTNPGAIGKLNNVEFKVCVPRKRSGS
jgi:hypothetical protein